MPWAWGRLTIDKPSGAYHLVWSRDLYQIATALLRGGRPRRRADRALDYLFDAPAEARRLVPAELRRRRHAALDQPPARRGRRSRSCSPGSSGAPTRATCGHVQAAPPTSSLAKGPAARRSAGRTRAATRRRRSRPRSPGWSAPPTSRAATATPPRRRAGEAIADDWQRSVGALDGDHQRPARAAAVLPAPHQATATPTPAPPTSIGDGGPSASTSARSSTRASSSSSASASSAPTIPTIAESLAVVDAQLRVDTPERARSGTATPSTATARSRTAAPWDLAPDEPVRHRSGRAWPIFAGERGEYELANGRAAGDAAWRRWAAPPTTAA